MRVYTSASLTPAPSPVVRRALVPIGSRGFAHVAPALQNVSLFFFRVFLHSRFTSYNSLNHSGTRGFSKTSDSLLRGLFGLDAAGMRREFIGSARVRFLKRDSMRWL